MQEMLRVSRPYAHVAGTGEKELAADERR
jgi:hypothetical protein